MGNSAGSETKDKKQPNKKETLNNTKKNRVKFAPEPPKTRNNNLNSQKTKNNNLDPQKSRKSNLNKQILNKTNTKVKNGGITAPKAKGKEAQNKPKPKPKPKPRKVKRGEPPPPTPPKLTKEDIMGDLDFTIIDEHALNAPNDLLLKSYWDIVKYLTDDYAWDDLCRVRAIYRWITSYSIKNFPIDINPPTNSPLEYFSKIQCDMGNYANLFYILCQLADVPCVIIDGVAKSSGYRIGEKMNKKRTKAQWNAVLVQGEWHLVDLFWASTCVELNSGQAKKLHKSKKEKERKEKANENSIADDDDNYSKPVVIDGKEIVPDKDPRDKTNDNKKASENSDANNKPVRKIPKPKKKLDLKKFRQIKHKEDADHSYFFTNPHDLSWTHLPDDEAWQLVKEPLSFYEFERRVYVRERLYELGIDIEGKPNVMCRHRTKQGKVSLEMKLPERWASKLAFTSNFYRSKSSPYCKEEDDGSLEHCVEMEVVRDRLQIDINIPVYGQFRLDIFGKNLILREVKEFDLICSYIIYCPMPPKIVIPMPDDPEIGWGQNKDSDKAGFKPITHKKPKVNTDNGIMEMKFQGPKNLNINVRVKHRKLDEGVLSKYVMLRWHEGEYILNLRLPVEGYYALKMYGKTEEPGKKNLLNYLIRCKQSKDLQDKPFPIVTQNILGESVLAKNLGIRILDKESGITTANKGRGKMHICVEGKEKLFYEIHSNNEEAMKRTNLIVKKEHGIDSVHYILPVAGEYVLGVYTHKENDITKLYTVYTSFIHSTGSLGDSVFTPRTQVGDNKGFWDGKHDIPTETIEATEKEVYLPYPDSPHEIVAYLDTTQGNGPQKNNAIELIKVDDETLFKISLPDINYCVANIYERNDGCLIKTIYRYFIVTTTDDENGGDYKTEEEEFPLIATSPEAVDLDKDEIDDRNNDYMRKKMREAELYKDPDVLNNIIAKHETNSSEFDESLIEKVKKLAKKLEARQALLDAYESRNIQDVEKGIALAQVADTDGSLQFEIMHATRLLQRLKIIHRLRETIVDADGKAIGESRKYANPPTPVKHSLMATLVLLGFPYYVVEDWPTTQSILWKMDEDSIQNKMARFDPRMAPLEFALDAKMIIESYTLDYMKTVSPLGTAFYVWVTQMIKEIESTAGTLGGFSEVYHDNEVGSENYSEENPATSSNGEPVVTGIGNVPNEEEITPINNPPIGHQSKSGREGVDSKQSIAIVSVSSPVNTDDVAH